MDLNNRLNLNPSIEEIRAAVTDTTPTIPPAILNQQEKAKEMEDWNATPTAKANKVKVIDTTKEKPVRKWKWTICIIFMIIGIIAFVGLSGVIGYTVYKDGTLLSPAMLICGNVSINIPQCPTSPAAPDCNCPSLTCGNTTSIINVYTNSS